MVDKTSPTPHGLGMHGATGFKNKVRNGNFMVNQRGVTGTVTLAAGAYGHDGVKGGASGATYTFALSSNDTILTITAGSLILPVDGMYLEAGTYVVGWEGTAQGRTYAQSASAPIYNARKPEGLLSSAITSGVNQIVEFTGGTISRVQFERGGVPTQFERSFFEIERCQRYYTRLRLSARFPASAGNQLMDVPVFLPTTMRSQPTSNGISGGQRGNLSNAVVTVLDAGSARYEIVSSAAGDCYALGDVFEFVAEQ